ncbi:MAG TPA: Gfo/Idh/MocA family oxidoreductase [Acidimicrobiia bacterium]|nr:Gfo/Idh/MocA family oxidoreductase [Acidimicrobiia bacterium]
MADRTLTIAMNGVTGRMGRSQHLERSIMAIRDQGGVETSHGEVMLEPILVGRNRERLAELARRFSLERWTTDLTSVLADPEVDIYFDSQRTDLRADAAIAAISAGKTIYCEKPLAETADVAHDLAARARSAGVKNGVVQDKLFLPGLLKLKGLIDEGFFGRILDVRIDFGYWVFEGHDQPAQRPSWNYRAEEGGSIILDMFPHWQYVIEGLFGPIESVSALGVTHIPTRYEDGEPYQATADDAAYGMMTLASGAIVQVSSSWVTRVNRDDLVIFQVDGVEGSAVAGLRDCKVQPRSDTPRPVWNPDIPNPHDFRSQWTEVRAGEQFDNGFKLQWEQFVRHVVDDEPFPWDFASAARGSDLVDAAMTSWRERRWVDLAS